MNERVPGRILHVITGLAQGGAETALHRLVSGTRDPRLHHVVSLTGEGVFAQRLREAGATVTALNARSSASFIFSLVRLFKLIRRERPVIVQTWMYHADLVGGIAARLAGTPVCWGIRQSNLMPSANKRSTLAIARICAALSSLVPQYIVSCSGRAIDTHRKFGYSGRFVHIPNGLDVSRYSTSAKARASIRQELSIPSGARVLGNVGRLHQQKDYPTLLEAFALLPSSLDARLLLVGKGLDRTMADFNQIEPSRHPSILAVGPRDDVPTVLQGLDFFVLSSVGEGFPNVVVEAMASGVPCIVTDVGDTAEIVGDTGWIVPASDPRALAQAMRLALAEDEAARQARSDAARARISEMYTIRKMVQSYENLWHQVRSFESGTSHKKFNLENRK